MTMTLSIAIKIGSPGSHHSPAEFRAFQSPVARSRWTEWLTWA